MSQMFSQYLQILRSWLSVTVYLWLLELQAASGIGPEPLLDSLADSSAILWTLTFWIAGLSVCVWLVSLVFRTSTVIRLNHLACKIALILTTGFYFLLWLYKWRLYYFDSDLPVFLLASCAVLLLWTSKMRRKRAAGDRRVVPSLEDCFYFATLPLMIASVVILAINSTKEMTARASVTHPFLSKTAATQARPNVILIVYDGLRAQNMSVYGYFRRTTPYLEKFAERSDLYMQMHANSTTTQPSMTTLLSGQHPFSHGRLTREIAPSEDANNLIRMLRDNGYTTAAITSNREASLFSLGFAPYLSRPEYAKFGNLTLSWLRDLGVLPTATGSRMYEHFSPIFPFLGFPGRTSHHGYSDDTLRTAKKILRELPQPFFLLLHLHEPHEPYYTSQAFVDTFSARDAVETKRRIPSGLYSYYPPELQPTINDYRDQYDESIQFLDSEFGKFMNLLEHSPWADNLLIALTADHGESFERGYFNHGEDLYENSTHVPLIIRFPRQEQGHRIPGLAQLTDIAPTILNAIGVPIPPWMDGQPLRQGNQPRETETIAVNFKHPVRGTHHPLPTKLAIWSGQYKMIVSCDRTRVELYDLAQDPGEVVDLSSHSHVMVKLLKQKLAFRLSVQSRRPAMSCAHD
jgi:arylsulfatase A-like enzyme